MSQNVNDAADAAHQAFANQVAENTAMLIGFKVLGLMGIFSAGLVGAACIAAFDPPENRRQLFAQAAVAGVGSVFFGPAIALVVQHFITWVDWAHLPAATAVEYNMPIYFVVGSMAWGVFGAMSKLRKLIAARGAEALAKRVGMDTPEEPKQ